MTWLLGLRALCRSFGFDGFDSAGYEFAELILTEVAETRGLVEGQFDALGHVAVASKVGFGSLDDDGAAKLFGRGVHTRPLVSLGDQMGLDGVGDAVNELVEDVIVAKEP